MRRVRRIYKVPAITPRVEQVLGWAPGSIDAIARGGEPTLAPPLDERRITAMLRALDESSTLTEEERETMRQLLRRHLRSGDLDRRRHA